uniref:Pre-mRNA 3'-end-processing factor FIP1 n=1 Tax=Panagrolaimus sp. JU765 TaxID=591449 RepID=A0AC34RL77_9BILA
MGGPGMGQHGRMPLLRNPSNQNGHDEAPPGVGSNRQSVDAPPGLDNFGSYSSGRDRERDRGRDRDRRRDSEGSTVLTQSTTGTAPQNIGTINLTGTGSSQSSAQPEKIVVDLTKPPPNFNLPPPGQDGDKSESGPPGTFNMNVPPPGVRMPSNMGNFNRPPMNMFNRPPMGNFYNPMGMMGGPGMGQHGRMPLLRNPSNQNGHDEAPPGVGSNRQSVDAPPGLDNFGSYSSGRDRERDRGRDRDRRRDSEGSDEDRRRRRRDRDRVGDDRRDRSDRGRERERDRDRDSSRKRRDSPERSSSRRDRDERKRSRDRDERESDRKRRREDKDDRDRHRRRERSPSKTSKNTEDHAGDDRPPGV